PHLLSEAHVIGALDHPNIVPIHDLLFDEAGRPQLLLKRIHGRSWLEVIENGIELREFGADPLESAIRVAIAVSRALSFAHERGVVHRDVKPSNVMIGHHGEVYLVDWGLAATFDRTSENAHLPPLHARDGGGTPSYMSPEQRRAQGHDVGPRTDVYLLAGTLLHAIVGRPPWQRRNDERYARVGLAPDTYPALSALLEKALAPDPEDRFDSAKSFRYALEAYLRQRVSRGLLESARRAVEDADAKGQEGDAQGAERAAIEAEVLFRASLSEWPSNAQAKRERRAFGEWRVRDALDRDEPTAAARLAASCPDLPAELGAQVSEALRESADESKRVSQMRRDVDRTVGAPMRVRLLSTCGPIWFAASLGTAMFNTVRVGLLLSLMVVVAYLLVALWFRKTMFANRLNTITYGAMGSALAGTAWIFGVAQLHGISAQFSAPLVMLMYLVCNASIAAAVERRGFFGVVLWSLLAITAVAVPNLGLWLVALGVGVWTVGALRINERLLPPPKRV
ncbi:MAG: serine/threonine-protein kinase, partial [Myxococcota bacterium]